MTRKLIDGDFSATHELKIYRDYDWQEFVAIVKEKATGKVVSEYFTDDKDDAKSTGRAELRQSTMAANAKIEAKQEAKIRTFLHNQAQGV